MTLKIFVFIITSVFLSASAQISMKFGMIHPNVQRALSQPNRLDLILSIGRSPGVLFGLAMYIISVSFWLMVLGKLDVSQAYPFVGLGFIFTMFLGFLLLGETLTLHKVLGTLFVIIGVYLVNMV